MEHCQTNFPFSLSLSLPALTDSLKVTEWIECTCKETALHPCLPLSRAVLEQNLFDDDSFLYDEVPGLLRFRTATPPIELLADWYISRAQAIDSCSRQVWKLSVSICSVQLVTITGFFGCQLQTVLCKSLGPHLVLSHFGCGCSSLLKPVQKYRGYSL